MRRIALLTCAVFSTAIGGLALATPICYMESEGGEVMNLNNICGDGENPGDDSVPQLSAEDYYQLALSQMVTGTPEEAIDSLTRAIEADPTNYHYYMERAAIHLFIGDRESARADYEAIVQDYIERGGNDPELLDYYQGLTEMI